MSYGLAMTIPKLKRIKVSTEQELRTWLSKKGAQPNQVMIVTCNAKSKDKHISSAAVRSVMSDSGWICDRSYTLDGNLMGHVVRAT